MASRLTRTWVAGLAAVWVLGRVGAGENLVPNGGLEKGKQTPEHWLPVDRLTSFWESGGVNGKCLHFDTDVYRSEWNEHRKSPDTPIRKTPTSGTKYDTVAGSVGVCVYSYPIPVAPDGCYLVEYDVRGQSGEAFIFVKGYEKVTPELAQRTGSLIFFRPQPDGPSFSLTEMGGVGEEKRPAVPGDYIMTFRKRIITKFGGGDRWYHCRGVLELAKRKGTRVEMLLLELYAYWPPGDYYFDNVSMRKITLEELKALEAEVDSDKTDWVKPRD